MNVSVRVRWLAPSLLSLAACSQPSAPRASPSTEPVPKTTVGLTSPALRLAMVEARQAEATGAHRVRADAASLRADVAEQQVSGSFDASGATLRSLGDGSVQGRLSLASVARSGGARQAVGEATPVAAEHAVRWEHPVSGGSVQETWQAGPLGLEHRVLVRQRPAGQGVVELEMAVEGLRAEADGERVRLRGERGSLAMSEYFVRDARGTLLAGAMSVRDGRVVYRYEDEGAQYPVEVDPLVWGQQAKLLPSDKGPSNYFGTSVSLSADGQTALVGKSPTVDPGAAYVFVRTGAAWSQQARLSGEGPSADGFGSAVSLSADGAVALVGALNNSAKGLNYNGAAYVFVRAGTTWSQQTKLTAIDKASQDGFGYSVSLSADGKNALIGVPYKTAGSTLKSGSAYVFHQVDDTWTQQAKLLASDKGMDQAFGNAVSLSSDGSTALVGAFHHTDSTMSYRGAAYVFTRSGGAWTQQAKLTSGKSSLEFGSAVSLAADGSTALVGDRAGLDTAGQKTGAAYVFRRADSDWSQQAKLLSSDMTPGDYLGDSVSLSSDGQTALIGASVESDGTSQANGAVYVFRQDGSTWSERAKLLALDKSSDDRLGLSVSLSSDGTTALAGAPGKANGNFKSVGAAYVFVLAKANGDACKDGPECASTFCVDGVCCNVACDTGACDACTKSTGADVDGTCKLLTSTPCDDGNACTGGDHCDGGTCKAVDQTICSPGQCQQGGSCDSTSGACSFTSKADGTPCATGTCQQGICVAGAGGAGGAGGLSGAGGESGISGQPGAGGAAGSGASGASGQAGAGATGGAAGKGSAAGVSGAAGKGGAGASSGQGGVAGKGGTGAGSGQGGAGKGGAAGTSAGTLSGASGQGPDVVASGDDGGCGCRVTGRAEGTGVWALAALAAGLGARRRRRTS